MDGSKQPQPGTSKDKEPSTSKSKDKDKQIQPSPSSQSSGKKKKKKDGSPSRSASDSSVKSLTEDQRNIGKINLRGHAGSVSQPSVRSLRIISDDSLQDQENEDDEHKDQS